MAELRYPMVSLNNSLFAFFGIEIEMWQIAIIGVLVVALVACIIVAAIKTENPHKKIHRKRRKGDFAQKTSARCQRGHIENQIRLRFKKEHAQRAT